MDVNLVNVFYLVRLFLGFLAVANCCEVGLAQGFDLQREQAVESGLQGNKMGNISERMAPLGTSSSDLVKIDEITISGTRSDLNASDVFDALHIFPGGKVSWSDLEKLPFILREYSESRDLSISYKWIFADRYSINIHIDDRTQGSLNGNAFVDDKGRLGLYFAWSQAGADKTFSDLSLSAVVTPQDGNYHVSFKAPTNLAIDPYLGITAQAMKTTNKYYKFKSIRAGLTHSETNNTDYFNLSFYISRRQSQFGLSNNWARNEAIELGFESGLAICNVDRCPRLELGIYHRVPLSRHYAKSTTFQLVGRGEVLVGSFGRLRHEVGVRVATTAESIGKQPLAEAFFMGGLGSVSGFERGEIGYRQSCPERCGGRLGGIARVGADLFLGVEGRNPRSYITAFWEGGAISASNLKARQNYHSIGFGAMGHVAHVNFELTAARSLNAGHRGFNFYVTLIKAFCISDESLFSLRGCSSR